MRRTVRAIPIAATTLVIAGALAVAGCGGGDSSSSTGASGASGAAGGTPLSQDEFVSQANAACADANAKLEALKAPTQGDLQSLGTFTAQLIPIGADLEAKLTAITPPTDMQAQYASYLSGQKAGFELATQISQAAKAGDSSKIAPLGQKLTSINDKSNADADALGLTECAKTVSPQR
jgi:hypothetical protein